MASNSASVLAILGPTNTGKTYFAMQMMMACDTGIIGFPLRLLARENYDKVVREKGRNAVALVTGEEKIIPKQARYFICTVEAMPLDREVDFIGVDEIQLCGDPERGHIFTDRLLYCRGRVKTVFLGSDTIRNLILQLIPEVRIETRPRLSKLIYTEPKKIGRVPRRSAIVAFSVAEVYRVAEELRHHRGGCSVVLGALSPRTRNAQVDMYQAGEVDYMATTDAIGMGLNMDLDNVTFARTRKFDGRKARSLTIQEIGQIAGRAGRHMSDGTFATTTEIGGFDDMTIEAVENHRFDPLQFLRWRGRDLNFTNANALLRSLDQRAPNDVLVKARQTEDLAALKQLLSIEEIRKIARGPAAVRSLWDVASVPDFRKTMTDMHISMLANVYKFLMKGTGKIPEDFVGNQISCLDDLKGDIDILINRIANIRTWTFISHRSDWVTNAEYWQDRSKKIDDRLSDALHERLTQKFVDRRATILVRSLVSGEKLTGRVEKDGNVVIEGQNVGVFKGFTFKSDPSIMGSHAKSVLTAARKILAEEVDVRLAQLVADNDGAFRLLENGVLLWRETPMGKLAKGHSILEPTVVVETSDLLESQSRERIKERLILWLRSHLNNRLSPYFQLQNANLTGTPRGLAYQLIESLGLLRRDDVLDMVKSLNRDERRALYDQNVRIGRYAIWVKGLTNPIHWPWRALLWGIWHDVKNPRELLPSGEAIVVEMPTGGWGMLRSDFFAMLGYVPIELFTPRAKPHRVYVRVDALDYVSNMLWQASNAGVFELPDGLSDKLACNESMLKRIVNALGFKRANEKDIERVRQRAEREKDEQAQKHAAKKEKEAARKAEMLVKEIVAVEGMEMSPKQILSMAEAEAEAFRSTGLGKRQDETGSASLQTKSDIEADSLLQTEVENEAVSDMGSDSEGDSEDQSDTTDAGNAKQKSLDDPAKELWVRVFRRSDRGDAPGQRVGNTRGRTSSDQHHRGKKGTFKEKEGNKFSKDFGSIPDNKKKPSGRKNKKKSNDMANRDVDADSPFAALAALKRK